MDEYFITKPNGQQEGPYGAEALYSRVVAGKYEEGTTVWFEGLSDWEPLFKHFPLQAAQEEQPTEGPQPEEEQLPTADELTALINALPTADNHPTTPEPHPQALPTFAAEPSPLTGESTTALTPDEEETEYPHPVPPILSPATTAPTEPPPFPEPQAPVQQEKGLRRPMSLAQFLICQLVLLLLIITAYFLFKDDAPTEQQSEQAEEIVNDEDFDFIPLPSQTQSTPETTASAEPAPAEEPATTPAPASTEPAPTPAPAPVPAPEQAPTTGKPETASTPAPEKKNIISALGSTLNPFSDQSAEEEEAFDEEEQQADKKEDTSDTPSDADTEEEESDIISADSGSSADDDNEGESNEELKELTDDDKKELGSLQRSMKNMYKRKSNCYKHIALFKHKIMLHEKCRSCGSGHCDSQGITGACRHWYMAPFDKKKIRVAHQLPRGNKRYSGIDQAISSLNIKIEQQKSLIDRVDEKIKEIADDIVKLTGSSSNIPAEPGYEYENYSPSSCSSYSNSYSFGKRSKYYR